MRTQPILVAGMMGACMAFAAPAAFAQARSQPDTGWYAGGSFGQTTAECDASPGLSCDDKDTTWKIFGGYQINRNFAVEAGYTDLGEVGATGAGTNIKIESTAWELVGVGSWPIANRLSIFGKLGFYRGETEVSSNIAGGSGDKSTTNLTYGVGARYDLTRNVALRAEWQRYQKVEAPNTTVTSGARDGDIEMLAAGVLWKF